ncbi:MAG: carboxymuconolactone decarboxylase family protein, partial [Qingshengfaniella sp.]
RFSSVPWEEGVLPGRLRELIYVAIDASTTHMFDEGTRQHMANALKLGATPQEIMAVLTLTSTLGLQSVDLGMAILNEVEKARQG